MQRRDPGGQNEEECRKTDARLMRVEQDIGERHDDRKGRDGSGRLPAPQPEGVPALSRRFARLDVGHEGPLACRR